MLGLAARIRCACMEDLSMAKGQMKSNKEARKPKKEKPKTIAAAPSTKGAVSLGEQKKAGK